MTVMLAKNWWALELRGLAAIALGAATLAWPRIGRGELVVLFGAYALIDGVLNLAGVLRAAEAHERWVPLLFEAAAGIATGLIALAWNAISLFQLMAVVAAWALVTGVFEILSAIRLRSYVPGEWLMALSGVASLMLGMLAVVIPLTSPFAAAEWLAAYALLFGALLIALGVRLRRALRQTDPGAAVPATTA